MDTVNHCAVIVRRPEDVWEASRAALGLAVENYHAALFVLGVPVPDEDRLKENLDWLEDMECQTFSDMPENAILGFSLLDGEALGAKLSEMDLVIPFGDRP